MSGADAVPVLPLAYSRMRAALRRIRYQFPQTALGRLHFAVVEQAVKDVYARNPALSRPAALYLYGDAGKPNDIWNAQACDVDPGWIRETLNTASRYREKAA